MKRFAKLMISGLMALGMGFSVYAEIPEKVEIKFAVGDETLLINGAATMVQKPYVVGDGVTLVPLRVITEAFGADVEWIGENQQIKLTYPDVNITLQIGNKIADVNGIAETLLSAPELKNDTTMVPLRFISETFGADVSYDPATMGITVIKEAADNTTGTIIDEVITATKIGDSYYGWSMETPVRMDMVYRSFDGSEVSFASDDLNGIDIIVYNKEEDYNFERDFIEWKNSLSQYTLVKADKNTDMIIKSMNFQAKDADEFLNILCFEKEKYIVTVVGYFDPANAQAKDEGIRLMSTFECAFDANDTYDFSDVKDGVREFKSDKLKLSFDVPQDYFMASAEDAENQFLFMISDADDYVSQINAEVYSKSAVTSAEALANKDHDGNKEYMDTKVATFTPVEASEYQNFKGFEYTYKISGSTYGDSYHKDVFFELGDYVYNVHVSQQNTSDAQKKADKVLNSVKAEVLNSEDIGILMRNDVDYEGTFVAKTSKWSISVPNSYQEIAEGQYLSLRHGATISLNVYDADGANLTDVKKEMEDVVEEMKKMSDIKVKTSPGQTKLAGNQTYMTYTLISEEDGSYLRQVAIVIADKKIVFTMLIPELYYSERTISELNSIITSYKNEY